MKMNQSKKVGVDYRLLRARAEKKPAGVTQANKDNFPQNTDELLQKLRIHQIELEMQNEKSRRAHTALETARDRYLQLFEFAPICYLTLTENGLITEANQTCAALLGVERNKLINRHFSRYIAPEDSDHWHRNFLYAKQHTGKHNYELKLYNPNGMASHTQVDCLNTVAIDGTPQLRITLTDITGIKKTEEEQRIAAVAFETPMGIIVTNANKLILRANQAFSRITGYSTDDVLGRTPSFLRSGVHDEDFYRDLWAYVTRDGYWQGEIWDKRKNGEIFPVWQTITAVTDKQGLLTHYVGSFTDITVQKQAEKVLLDARQHLENRVASSQEELEKIKAESAAINTALGVLLKQRETDKSDAQRALSVEMEGCVLPFLEKLKKTNSHRQQSILIDILENNLQQAVKTYGRNSDLSLAYQQLSPVEVLVASLVRQGLSTKLIATTLNIALGTANIHRKHIRKKLQLHNKTANLRSYLLSLAE
ncbi:MAG: PAS domain S-box protein [Methylovulum miyakonense]|uniref:PAS domain S-box protein n=1 Tax=Methylovulum miyakonense TaxID=645578 RepID=UPI003BB67EAF